MSSPPRKKKRDRKEPTKNLVIPLVTTNRKKLDLLKTNKVNKSNMRKETKTILTILTIILTFKEATPINVRHASKHVSVHAILGISNTTEHPQRTQKSFKMFCYLGPSDLNCSASENYQGIRIIKRSRVHFLPTQNLKIFQNVLLTRPFGPRSLRFPKLICFFLFCLSWPSQVLP